jgi:hypothetical protein
VDLGMTFEADWDCVFDPVPAILIDMVRLDLDAAKTVADATSAAASHEEVCYLVSVELASHRFDDSSSDHS